MLVEKPLATTLAEADAIVDAGGIALADEWIHASDLIAVGVAAAAE